MKTKFFNANWLTGINRNLIMGTLDNLKIEVALDEVISKSTLILAKKGRHKTSKKGLNKTTQAIIGQDKTLYILITLVASSYAIEQGSRWLECLYEQNIL
jgi:hypothetical protein